MRVGTSVSKLLRPPLAWDHPHACGDKKAFLEKVKKAGGSSPCVWGQEVVVILLCDCCRIIPMRVGTRLESISMPPIPKDHPHACGDKRETHSESRENPGSSPCVWGQDYSPTAHIQFERIIPMRVGTRYSQ